MKQWLDNDELFKSELEQGQAWERWLSRMLTYYGVYNFCPPQRFRKTDKSDIGEFANQKDIIFGRYVSRWIEVKSRNVTFTTAEDFPYDTLFVCTAADWAVKKPKPSAIAIISRPTKSVVFIPGGTRPEWKAERKFDRIRKINDTFLEAPRSVVVTSEEFIRWAREQDGRY